MEELVGHDLTLRVERHGRHVVLHISGSAGLGDIDGMTAMLRRFSTHPDTVVILDLHDLQFINAEGLDAIVAQNTASRLLSSQLRLVSPQPHVRHLLDLTRLSELLPVYGSLDQALTDA